MEATAAIAGSSSTASEIAAAPLVPQSSERNDDTESRHSGHSNLNFAVKASMSTTPESSLKDAAKSFNINTNTPKASTAFGAQPDDNDTHTHDQDREAPRLRSSRMFKPLHAVAIEKKKLLDLPLDILKDIIKEVTHTNDLTSLALCHSALHRLTIPHIYSRFDIVWPDSSTHAEPRSGVDALTYGLATLVMAEEIFGEAPNQRQHSHNNNNNNNNNNRFNAGNKSGSGRASEMAIRRRRGNHYAQFTKKFSLGNGPADWVQEYLISKEGGKMLGTLVALAVARMRSLETFIWDMPTGILRDVWLALSSLGDGDRDDGQECRLEKLWVRWHDNSANVVDHLQGPAHGIAQVPAIPGQPQLTQISSADLDRVEHPSFSVLPPLKSLSVLDIDELAYLDEMAVLIGRSIDKLKELRVGIARHAMTKDWVTVWEGDVVQQVDRDYPTAGSVTIGEKRLGGVLGTLTGFVCDMRKPRVVLPDRTKLRRRSSPIVVGNAGPDAAVPPPEQQLSVETNPQTDTEAPAASPESTLSFSSPTTEPSSLFGFALPENPTIQVEPPTADSIAIAIENPSDSDSQPQEPQLPEETTPFSPIHETLPLEPPPEDLEEPRLAHKLKLQSLELERVPLSIPVLQKAFDWTILTSLTLLHCPNHEQLWKTLRRNFQPRPKSPVYPHARLRASTNSTPRKKSSGSAAYSATTAPAAEMEYGLNLKKIHTNTVSPSLISFLKETLAPNTLEVLFLQDSRAFPSSVTIESIYRGPLRRHRGSLQKLLIDSSEKGPDGHPVPNSTRWRRWMLTREILGNVLGGKWTGLRELGCAMGYPDWHFFLQGLPRVMGLRSFYLTYLGDYGGGGGNGGQHGYDARELALQVVDIVALRGDVEVCYLGVGGKCFEILENRRGEGEASGGSHHGMLGHGTGHQGGSEDEEDEEDEEEMEDEEGVEVEEDDEDEITEDDEDGEEDDEDDDDRSVLSDEGEGRGGQCRLRLREILFYDDKVAIFKARHGRL